MKKFWESKTFWANLIIIIIAIVEKVGGFNWISNEIMVFVMTVLNLILRLFFTEKKLTS